MSRTFTRFSARQRTEHVAVMVAFTVLCLTGLPQKFHGSAWAPRLIELLGGIDSVRWIHRFFGLVMGAVTLLHFDGVLRGVVLRRRRLTMVPTRRDFQDAVDTLRYYLSLRDQPPRYDRFDYKQKFEYWGLLVGNVVMLLTGTILIYPAFVTRYLPGEIVPAAKVAHSNEGLMAFLVIIVWHVYNAHLNPDVFPFDTTIFTGRISRERMAHEHPLELERLEGDPGGAGKDAGGHAGGEVD
jgi:cytochrome b subunit of formate dehydrogenase